MKLDATGAAGEAGDQQSPAVLPAALTERETEECFSDKVVTDSGGDGKILRHLHLDVLSVQLGHVSVPVDGGLAGVVDPVHGASLRGQLPQLHGLAERVSESDSLFDGNTGATMIAQVSAEIRLDCRLGTACHS